MIPKYPKLQTLVAKNNFKGIKKKARKLFSFDEPLKTIFFLSLVIAGNLPHNKKVDLINLARKKFSALTLEKFKEVVEVYHQLYGQIIKTDNTDFILFDICNVLAGNPFGNFNESLAIIKNVTQELKQNLYSWEDNKFHIFLPFLLGIISLDGIIYTWRNFLYLAKQDSQAKNILMDLFIIFHQYEREHIILLDNSEWNKEKDISVAVSGKFLEMTNFFGPDNKLYLPVPLDCQEFVRTVDQEAKSYIQGKNSAFMELIDHFIEKKEDYCLSFDAMWKDIVTSPKAGIRSNGRDKVKISFDVLKNFGYTHLQFIQENLTFPECMVKFWLRQEEAVFSLTFKLEPKPLTQCSYKDDENDPRAIVDFVLNYIALQCYWKIVTGKDIKQPERQKRTKGSRQNSKRTSAKHIVRPRFRSLPVGQNPSQAAIDRAIEHFTYEPPPGFTFVREYKTGIAEFESIAPLFTYSKKYFW